MAKVIEWNIAAPPAVSRLSWCTASTATRFPTRGRVNARSAEAKLCYGCSRFSVLTLSLQRLSSGSQTCLHICRQRVGSHRSVPLIQTTSSVRVLSCASTLAVVAESRHPYGGI
jgi:hypothetical protein